MDGINNTQEQVIQELIALQTRSLETGLSETPEDAIVISEDPILNLLLVELSLFGDGVGTLVDKSDSYFSLENPDASQFQAAVHRATVGKAGLTDSLIDIINKMK